jgi:lipid II:glycine glycyltransferase (peptidoglycan interpeptide bridge formation enzyme)
MLDLAKGADALFADFSQTRRNELRRAIKQDSLIVREPESEAEIAELYEVHKDWNARKGNQPDSREDFFTTANDRVYRKTLIAIFDGKIIAGSSYRFCPGGVVEYSGNNSLPEFQKLRPNDLIGWRAIEWACAAGFTHFSMGGSHMFLRRFGGRVQPAYRYTQDRTFFKLHRNREKLKRLAASAYMSLPLSARQTIKSVLGKES